MALVMFHGRMRGHLPSSLENNKQQMKDWAEVRSEEQFSQKSAWAFFEEDLAELELLTPSPHSSLNKYFIEMKSQALVDVTSDVF